MTAGLDVHLWWAALTAADAALEADLPPAERARLEGLAGADRARRMVGAALLRQAVRQHRGADAAEIVVDRTCEECGAQHGRPVVAGGPHVSVAHAGVLVVVATCVTSPVGVDVERISRFSGEQAPAGAAAAWVALEARLKAGAGPAGGAKSGTDVPETSMIRLEPPLAGYAAALCVAAPAQDGVHLVVHR